MRLLVMLFAVGLITGISTPIQAQTDNTNAIDTYFKQYVDDDRFSVVYISGRLFKMLGSLDKETVRFEDQEDADALMKVAKELEGLRILTAEEDVEQLYQEAKAKIETSIYEPLMTVRGRDGDNIELLIREGDGKIKELLMLGSGDEFFLLSFIGNLDLDEISKLANEIEH